MQGNVLCSREASFRSGTGERQDCTGPICSADELLVLESGGCEAVIVLDVYSLQYCAVIRSACHYAAEKPGRDIMVRYMAVLSAARYMAGFWEGSTSAFVGDEQ